MKNWEKQFALMQQMQNTLNKQLETHNPYYEKNQLGSSGIPFWQAFAEGWNATNMFRDLQERVRENKRRKEIQEKNDAPLTQNRSPQVSQQGVPVANTAQPNVLFQGRDDNTAWGNALRNNILEGNSLMDAVNGQETAPAQQVQQQNQVAPQTEYQQLMSQIPQSEYLGDDYKSLNWIRNNSANGNSKYPWVDQMRYYQYIAPMVEDAREDRLREMYYRINTAQTPEEEKKWAAALAFELNDPDYVYTRQRRRDKDKLDDNKLRMDVLHREGLWSNRIAKEFGLDALEGAESMYGNYFKAPSQRFTEEAQARDLANRRAIANAELSLKRDRLNHDIDLSEREFRAKYGNGAGNEQMARELLRASGNTLGQLETILASPNATDEEKAAASKAWNKQMGDFQKAIGIIYNDEIRKTSNPTEAARNVYEQLNDGTERFGMSKPTLTGAIGSVVSTKLPGIAETDLQNYLRVYAEELGNNTTPTNTQSNVAGNGNIKGSIANASFKDKVQPNVQPSQVNQDVYNKVAQGLNQQPQYPTNNEYPYQQVPGQLGMSEIDYYNDRDVDIKRNSDFGRAFDELARRRVFS